MFTFDEQRTVWFMRFILPHEPSLKAWLRSKRSIVSDVEDIVQEAYSILAALESVSEIRFPRAYLFQVAHSLVVRDIRRARVVSFQAMEDLAVNDWADDAPSPETVAIDRDELRRIGEAIAAMPEQMGRAFTLRRINGLSQRDIAQEMRLSENTVEKHISRGIRFLSEWFGSGGRPGSQSSRVAQRESFASHDNKRVQSEH